MSQLALLLLLSLSLSHYLSLPLSLSLSHMCLYIQGYHTLYFNFSRSENGNDSDLICPTQSLVSCCMQQQQQPYIWKHEKKKSLIVKTLLPW